MSGAGERAFFCFPAFSGGAAERNLVKQFQSLLIEFSMVFFVCAFALAFYSAAFAEMARERKSKKGCNTTEQCNRTNDCSDSKYEQFIYAFTLSP
jgi:hypothetical protein